MRSHSLSFAAVVMWLPAVAQNLIPNPSFEDYNFDCGWVIANSSNIYAWTQPACAFQAGYCNACLNQWGSPDGSVPHNEVGYAEPSDGDAYARIATYGDWYPEWNPRQYLTVALWEPLEGGQQYCVRLKMSLCDSASYRTSELHCFLWVDTPSVCSNIDQQIADNANVTLNTQQVDTAGWTLVEGSFVANGGETTLTLGDFNVAQNMDTTFIAHRFQVEFAGYYLDEVFLGACDNAMDDRGLPNKHMVYPNPVREGEWLWVRIPQAWALASFELVDALGQTVRSGVLNEGVDRLSVVGFAPGHYELRVTSKSGASATHIVIER